MELDFSEQIKAKWDMGMKKASDAQMPHNKKEEMMEPKNHNEEMENEAAQQKFGGKKRSDLKDSDFLFPETRSFPIVSPQDVKDAISNFGRMKGTMSYDEFLKKLYAFCKKKGPEFVSALPMASKQKLGIKE